MSDHREVLNSRPEATGEWVLLEAHFPGQGVEPIGVLLLDVSRNQLHVKLRPNWWHSSNDELEAELWAGLSEDLTERAERLGGSELLDWLENTASHVIQFGPRQLIPFTNVHLCLDDLYRQYISPLHRLAADRS